MFTINNAGSEISVVVAGHYPVKDWTWTFKINMSHEAYAILVAQNFRDSMFARLKQIREEAYLEGWKDAKAKTRKKIYFRGVW